MKRIAGQLRRSFEGEAWHGPALRELLLDVSAEDAAARPLAGAHSIWEIVLHIIGSEEPVSERLQGKPKVLSPEEDWPSIKDISEEAWRAYVHALHTVHALPDLPTHGNAARRK